MHTLDVGAVAHSLAFAPDGRTLACALRDRILLVDAENGTRIRELGPLPKQDLLVAFSRDRLLSAGTDGYARRWDTNRGVATDWFATGEVRNLAFSPDGRWLVTTPSAVWGGWEKKRESPFTLWDLDHDRKSPPILSSAGPVESLAVSVEGIVAVGHPCQTIEVFETRTGKLLRTLHGGGQLYESIGPLAFSVDVPRLLAAQCSFSDIALFDVGEGRLLGRTFAHIGDALSPTPEITAMVSAGRLFLAGGDRGIAEIWRIKGRPESGLRAIARLSDYASLRRLNDPGLWASVLALAVTRDASLVATSYNDNKIRIWRGPGPR